MTRTLCSRSRFLLHTVRGLLAGAALLCAAVATEAATVPGDYASIQAAIDAVVSGALPDGTVINILPGTYAERLTIGATTRTFTLRGTAGAASTIVDAGQAGTALTINGASGVVTVRGLTFRNGARPNGVGGGFVFTNTSPAIVQCVFELNTASAGAGGVLTTSNATFTSTAIRNNTTTSRAGGLLIQTYSSPVFTQVDITGNASGTGSGGVGNQAVGGGVQSVDSSPTFRGSRITGNSSKFAGGGIYHAGSFGVAPFRLTLDDTEVSDNVSAPYTPADPPAEGGGIHIEDNVVAALTRVKVARNRANTGGGLNAYRARYDLVDTVVEGNVANGRADGGIGGGITASSTNVSVPARPASVLTLTRSLVRNNTGITGGGVVVTGDIGLPATLSMADSVIDSNTAQALGGGVHISRTNMSAANSMIIRNSVAGGTSPFGGGLLITTISAATLTNSTIAANSATVYGGGIFMDSETVLNLTSSNIYDNVAPANGGGGGLFVGPNGTNAATVQNSTIADNTGYQVIEHRGCPLPYSRLTSNVITPRSGSTDLYASFCGTLTSISQLNAGGSGLATGNTSAVPRFAHVLAVPGNGTSTTLVWSIARASSVTFTGSATPPSNLPTGAVDLGLTANSAYSVSASTASGAIGPVFVAVTYVPPPAGATLRPAAADFDGDGRSDMSVYRPTNGTWFSLNTASAGYGAVQWGWSTDVPTPGDYDGDGRADQAVLRPSTYTWYIRNSTNGSLTQVQWGLASDVPVPADYDGDGRTDIAVWRPANGTWYIRNSSSGAMAVVQWGWSTDTPVVGDFDGDGRAEVSVFRGSTGTWYVRNLNSGTITTQQWGWPTDIPLLKRPN